MDLKSYKEKYKLKNCELARKLRVSPSTLHHWLSGRASPSNNHAVNIYFKTGKEVTLEDLGITGDVKRRRKKNNSPD